MENKENMNPMQELSDEELSQVTGGAYIEAATQVAANIAAQDSALAKESFEALTKAQAESSFMGKSAAMVKHKASALFNPKAFKPSVSPKDK